MAILKNAKVCFFLLAVLLGIGIGASHIVPSLARSCTDPRAAWRIWTEVTSNDVKVYEAVEILTYNRELALWEVAASFEKNLTPQCVTHGQLRFENREGVNMVYFDGDSYIECQDINLRAVIQELAAIANVDYSLICLGGGPDCRISGSGISITTTANIDDIPHEYYEYPIFSYKHIRLFVPQSYPQTAIGWEVNGHRTVPVVFPGTVNHNHVLAVEQIPFPWQSPMPFLICMDGNFCYMVEGEESYEYESATTPFYIGYDDRGDEDLYLSGWLSSMKFDPTNSCAVCGE